MRVTIGDGYTLPERVADDHGCAIVFSYRPPLFEEVMKFKYAYNRCVSGEEQVKLSAEFVTAHVTEWDVLKKGGPGDALSPAPISPESVRGLPPHLGELLLNKVLEWAPNEQGRQEGN